MDMFIFEICIKLQYILDFCLKHSSFQVVISRHSELANTASYRFLISRPIEL